MDVEPPLAGMLRAGFVIKEFYQHRSLNLAEELNGRMVIAELAFDERRNVKLLKEKFEQLFVYGAEKKKGFDINGIDWKSKNFAALCR